MYDFLKKPVTPPRGIRNQRSTALMLRHECSNLYNATIVRLNPLLKLCEV
ncbi:hypothetical protein H6F76_24445 [Leptolyngbya sp. FACHB-321]|nr:hypothetical protein [Leptolyngbya sp. FACHB-321]MBD2038106.1 hypothetical protein [Leptolyngbya sp. FACHB-321]